MKRKLQGKYVKISTAGEKARAFIPAPLPPKPPIHWTSKLQGKFDQPLLVPGRLDSISTLLSDTSLLLYMYIQKEAVFSSMIEGPRSSLSDLLLFELDQEPGVPLNDVQKVSNYEAALEYGLGRLKKGLPLSLRLFREIHRVLMLKGSGERVLCPASGEGGARMHEQIRTLSTRPTSTFTSKHTGRPIMNC